MSTVNQRRIRRIAARRYERASEVAWRDFLKQGWGEGTREWSVTVGDIEARLAADNEINKPWWRFWL
ncbi:hypothetical protein CH298_13320 [Rhodococcoides fascians]|uniref:hypothetical protein n=1 Tax=Rhodococcoides fascians TaxID=1828 RepID=UPI000B9C137E|nr:hypothetical protein [Rhodococcus fascians]OZE89959.1 hypothetical protein CH303_13200 [Rhodococcus fascians]OZF18266.1 hypothetical protein CH298_13320 [Rhodococcus fascians]OZF21717.1 hypothetical protein CH297_13215 [Rhodococcus fascians]OZF67342.1 hypothetical protein CH308_13115 [Rhodococcus fascians]OZF70532.1 hypothetical protein CH307_13315 [Rhodococcus fascians]